MFVISNNISLQDAEIIFSDIRASGPGGQNVNKVASAVQLRFDIRASSLPAFYKQRLLALHDQRINKDGVIIIKAQQYRSREKNRQDALQRLAALVRAAGVVTKKRRPTTPSPAARQRRLDNKASQGRKKALRRKVTE